MISLPSRHASTVFAAGLFSRALFCPAARLAFLLALLSCASTSLVSADVYVPFVPPGLNPGDKYHVAFVTAGTRDATSTNIDNYNAFVQAEAELTGAETEFWNITWKAIGSTAIVDANVNAPVTAPVYLLNGDLVATGFTDMWDGSINNAIEITQFGAVGAHGEFSIVHTGTQTNGVAWPLGALGDPDLDDFITIIGLYTAIDGDWIDVGVFGYEEMLPFYALSEELTVASEAVPEPSTYALGLLGLAIGAAFKRRRVLMLPRYFKRLSGTRGLR